MNIKEATYSSIFTILAVTGILLTQAAVKNSYIEFQLYVPLTLGLIATVVCLITRSIKESFTLPTVMISIGLTSIDFVVINQILEMCKKNTVHVMFSTITLIYLMIVIISRRRFDHFTFTGFFAVIFTAIFIGQTEVYEQKMAYFRVYDIEGLLFDPINPKGLIITAFIFVKTLFTEFFMFNSLPKRNGLVSAISMSTMAVILPFFQSGLLKEEISNLKNVWYLLIPGSLLLGIAYSFVLALKKTKQKLTISQFLPIGFIIAQCLFFINSADILFVKTLMDKICMPIYAFFVVGHIFFAILVYILVKKLSNAPEIENEGNRNQQTGPGDEHVVNVPTNNNTTGQVNAPIAQNGQGILRNNPYFANLVNDISILLGLNQPAEPQTNQRNRTPPRSPGNRVNRSRPNINVPDNNNTNNNR